MDRLWNLVVRGRVVARGSMGDRVDRIVLKRLDIWSDWLKECMSWMWRVEGIGAGLECGGRTE